MSKRRTTLLSAFIALLGKVMNGVVLLACATATGWAGQLLYARQALPYNAAGRYFNSQTGITYDKQIVSVAFGLLVLFATLTGLLLVSAYKLYGTTPRRPAR